MVLEELRRGASIHTELGGSALSHNLKAAHYRQNKIDETSKSPLDNIGEL